MSRQLDFTKKLSEQDRTWALQFPTLYGDAVAQNDAEFGVEPDDAQPEAVNYESQTVQWLVSEVKRRNEEYGTDMSATGNKSELVQRLKDDDAANAE